MRHTRGLVKVSNTLHHLGKEKAGHALTKCSLFDERKQVSMLDKLEDNEEDLGALPTRLDN